SGVDHVYIRLAKPITTSSGTFVSTNTLLSLYDSNDPFSDGQSSGSYTLSHLNAPGSYAIDSVEVYDKVNNKHTYSSGDLAALGSPTSISLTGGAPDTTSPILTSLTFGSSFDLSSSDKPI